MKGNENGGAGDSHWGGRANRNMESFSHSCLSWSSSFNAMGFLLSQRSGSKMAAIWKSRRNCASHDAIVTFGGPQRKHHWTYYLPSKLHFHNLLNTIRVI